jgi:flagellar export protein FliJ
MTPKFSLQSVLDYRHSLVEALEIDLGLLVRAQQEKVTALELTINSHSDLCDQLYKSESGDVDLFMVQYLNANINRVREKIVSLHKDLRQLEAQVNAKRQELVSARQSEETLGTLKNKAIQRFQIEQSKSELRSQDEIYIARGFRGRNQDQ